MQLDISACAARFWAKVDIRSPDECWPWLASTTDEGYGKFAVESGGWELAHRVSWKLSSDESIDEFLVLHSCDNPPCVNFVHLFKGTQFDNMQDAHRKGRIRGMSFTHCKNGHEFTHENTYQRKSGGGARSCRACNVDANRRYRMRISK